jgi:isocitrate dehydrogenase kinase/phosphatase
MSDSEKDQSVDNGLSVAKAEAIYQAFHQYRNRFQEITCRAKSRFENRDWAGMQQDMAERLELREKCVSEIVGQLKNELEQQAENKTIWTDMKQHYFNLIAQRPDRELAETFFNSVTRRIFTTVGVDPAIEFVTFDLDVPPARPKSDIYRVYYRKSTTQALLKEILADCPFSVGYCNLEEHTRLAAREIEAQLRAIYGHQPTIDVADILKSVFYRRKGAYIVGRLRIGSEIIPLALALLNTEDGVVIDAVLVTQDELSIVFSFTRSYFHVETDEPRALIAFLKSLLPLKRIAELYISIGFHKHGKTELYRDFMRHLARSDDRFEIAKGEKGMVMTVFTLPSYDIVFKIIKDRFSQPKKTTRAKVMDRYQMVFKHDRAGRLVDTQEFEYLTFDKARFSPDLLEELLKVAANSVIVDNSTVVIKHLYTERRLTPLNLYLQAASLEAAQEAVRDCGRCIKDLAATNIFPGDFLLKNFGVTRHGRVVFYDYDELCFVTDCNFRNIPPARNFDDEFGDQPWYFADEADIFPEEFKTFIGLPRRLMEVFAEVHADLFGVEFWQNIQVRHHAGETVDIFPYVQRKRLTLDERTMA